MCLHFSSECVKQFCSGAIKWWYMLEIIFILGLFVSEQFRTVESEGVVMTFSYDLNNETLNFFVWKYLS
jgi:hypothetical protein